MWDFKNTHFGLIKSTGNEIGDKGAESIGKALETNASLTELYLDSQFQQMKIRPWAEFQKTYTLF